MVLYGIFFIFMLQTLSHPSSSVHGAPTGAARGKAPPVPSSVDPKVRVEQGYIQGTRHNVLDTQVDAFLGIPFAEPPVGKNRFRPPMKKQPWSGIEPTTKLASACMQEQDKIFPGFRGSEMWNADKQDILEDCLYLNLWRPVNSTNLATMVWIYGGGFFYGSPSLPLYNGKVLAAQGNVIVVNINYRVGPFGFLYLATDQAPGNMGLLDQQMALKWIHENIKAFGGNPNKITIFGESAGSASVSTHLLAKDSRPLFQQAILQSGSILNPWATLPPEELLNNSLALAQVLGCRSASSHGSNHPEKEGNDRAPDYPAIIKCMVEKPAKVISASYSKVSVGFLEFAFVPMSQDRNFFKTDVKEMLDSDDIKKCPLMIGINSDEGSFWLVYYLDKYFKHSGPTYISRSEFVDNVNISFARFPEVVRKSIAFEYGDLSNCDPSELNSRSVKYRDATNHMVGDFYFGCDTLEFARQMKSRLSGTGHPVYSYYFNQRISTNPWPEWMGTMHAYEIEYIFGAPLARPKDFKDTEVVFSRTVIEYWTNFAKNGKPTTTGAWPPMSWRNECRELRATSADILEDVKKDKCKFWKEIKELTESKSASGAGGSLRYSESFRGALHIKIISNIAAWFTISRYLFLTHN